MAKRKRDDIPEDLKHMDSVSPVGGYDGPASETEAAEESILPDLPEPDLSAPDAPESEEAPAEAEEAPAEESEPSSEEESAPETE